MSTTDSIITASAPGRLDVMGGIADYSGSLVLQMPIAEETEVRVRLRDDFKCNIHSLTSDGVRLKAELNYQHFLNNGKAEARFAHEQFVRQPQLMWAAYVLGTAVVLQQLKGIDFRGADIVIRSLVPMGKGVSSSASLEVATMRALGKAFKVVFAGTELPRLAQFVENVVVGAPCGLMDQLACHMGVKGKLLPIRCQPDEVDEPLSLPAEVRLMGIDSGVRHAVGGASYSDVRCAAFMGYSIIAAASGAGKAEIEEALRTKEFSKLPFQGFLCNVPVLDFESKFRELLPESLTGKEFRMKYGQTIDSVTRIADDKSYAVLACTSHPVYEMNRVTRFRSLLTAFHDGMIPGSQKVLFRKLGELMVQSHEGYTRCGLGSARTDEMVQMALESSRNEIYGARITGGGSGGTVCLLASGDEGKQQVKELHRQLLAKYGPLALFDTSAEV